MNFFSVPLNVEMELVVDNVFACDYTHEFKMIRHRYVRRASQWKNATANT